MTEELKKTHCANDTKTWFALNVRGGVISAAAVLDIDIQTGLLEPSFIASAPGGNAFGRRLLHANSEQVLRDFAAGVHKAILKHPDAKMGKSAKG